MTKKVSILIPYKKNAWMFIFKLDNKRLKGSQNINKQLTVFIVIYMLNVTHSIACKAVRNVHIYAYIVWNNQIIKKTKGLIGWKIKYHICLLQFYTVSHYKNGQDLLGIQCCTTKTRIAGPVPPTLHIVYSPWNLVQRAGQFN